MFLIINVFIMEDSCMHADMLVACVYFLNDDIYTIHGN